MGIDSSIVIRKVDSRDWLRIREICCLTGNSGNPIAAERWPFFGEQWVGPYQRLCAEWAYVATEGSDILAYLTGCPDSKAFRFKKQVLVDLPLLAKLLFGRFPRNADAKRFARRTLGMDTGPEQRFSTETRRLLERRFPAHLHINADERFRGKGVGKALVERFVTDLASLRPGCAGIHVFCGPKPVPFYKRVGFQEIERIEFSPGVWVYSMGRTLLPSNK